MLSVGPGDAASALVVAPLLHSTSQLVAPGRFSFRRQHSPRHRFIGGSLPCVHGCDGAGRADYTTEGLRVSLLQFGSMAVDLLVHPVDEPCLQLLQQLSYG